MRQYGAANGVSDSFHGIQAKSGAETNVIRSAFASVWEVATGWPWALVCHINISHVRCDDMFSVNARV